MSYRYIALLGSERLHQDALSRIEFLLRSQGLSERLSNGAVRLFASKDTPTLTVAGSGVIVGHLFSRSGARISDPRDLPPALTGPGMRKYLLERCWGGYVLIQPSDDNMGVIAMRDPSPSGEMPCIYALGRDDTAFVTSDLTLACDVDLYRKRVDWDFIAHRLIYPHVKTARTGLSGVRELLPGCLLRIHPSGASTEMAWSPWHFVSPSHRYPSARDAEPVIRSAVQSAVSAWADTDASVLLELSGGLDSSIVAACLGKTQAQVVCCTLLAPLPGADERQYASLMAAQLGVALHAEELRFECARFSFTPPERALTPRVGPLQYAVNDAMEAAADRHGVASFFSGGGGDTVFGYLRTAAPAADAFRERGFSAGIAAVRHLADIHDCTVLEAGRLALWKLFRAPKAPCKRDDSFVLLGGRTVTLERHPWFDAPPAALPGDRERVFDLASNQMFRDNVPRGTARPMRMPLLSQPVVEACLRAPSWMWVAGGQNRALARTTFTRMLPPEVTNRRSKGTFMGFLGSTYQRNRMQMREFLLDGQLQAKGLLNTDALTKFLDDPLPARDQTFTRIFDLCMVENWVRGQPSSPGELS